MNNIPLPIGSLTDLTAYTTKEVLNFKKGDRFFLRSRKYRIFDAYGEVYQNYRDNRYIVLDIKKSRNIRTNNTGPHKDWKNADEDIKRIVIYYDDVGTPDIQFFKPSLTSGGKRRKSKTAKKRRTRRRT